MRRALESFYRVMHSTSKLTQHGHVVIIAAIFLAVQLVLASRVQTVSGPDAVGYLVASRDLLHYDSAFHPPLYSVLIAAGRVVVGDEFLAAKLLSAIAGTSAVVATYALGRGFFGGPRAGALAAALVAVSCPFVNWSHHAYSDVVAAAFALGAVVALAPVLGNADYSGCALGRLAVAGLLAGLAYLTRYIAVAVPIVATAFLLLWPRRALRSRILQAAPFFAAFLVTIAPWSLACLLRHGSLYNRNYVNVAFAMFDSQANWNHFEDYGRRYSGILAIAIAEPVALVLHAVRTSVELAKEIARMGPLAALAAVPGFVLAARQRSGGSALAITVAAAFGVLTVLTWVEGRFLLPLLPLVFLLAGRFVVHLKPRLSFVVALLAVTTTAASSLRLGVLNNNVRDEERRMGLVLKERLAPGAPILTSSEIVCYYADRPCIPIAPLDATPAEQLVAAMRTSGARAIVFSQRHSVREAPALRFLLEPSDARVPAALRIVHRELPPTAIVAYGLSP